MGNLTVACLGTLGYGANLGKKGTSTDITFYNLKKGEDTVTLVEPTRYPERLAPLFYAVSLSQKAIIFVDEINATLGENLVILQCSNIASGYIVLSNFVSKEKIEQLIKGTSLEKYQIINDDPNYIREELLTEASKQKPIETASKSNSGTVPVDHAFNVKGVGVVILGVVAAGSIQKHNILNIMPNSKTAQIRSIQKHDDEFDSASEGDRVGLALKNVEVSDLDRGTVLTNDPSIKSSTTLKSKATLVKYWQTPIKAGMVVHLGHWMQFITCKVDEVTDEGDWRKPTLKLTLDKPLVHQPKDKAVLMYLEGAKLRVAGILDTE